MRAWTLLILSARGAAGAFVVDVSVTDESGAPLAGAAVVAETTPRFSADPWNAPARCIRVEATSDPRGLARLAGEHALPGLVLTVAQLGFYPASRRIARTEPAASLVLPRRSASVASTRASCLFRGLPWDGSEHGFDLVMGAFTPPLGVGCRSDVWISGRRGLASHPVAVPEVCVDELVMRFAGPGDGVVATPRPGQPGFAASVSPACEGLLLPGLAHPRRAPAEGYVDRLVHRSERVGGAVVAGRIGGPQWIFRVHREGGVLHGVITDFGCITDGQLRLDCQASSEPGNPSLEFGP